jgi:hypothetical protein
MYSDRYVDASGVRRLNRHFIRIPELFLQSCKAIDVFRASETFATRTRFTDASYQSCNKF